MEEIYIIKELLRDESVIAAETMNEREYDFSKGKAWDEERPNRKGYKVRYLDGRVVWFVEEGFERMYRKMTLKEAEKVWEWVSSKKGDDK